MGEVTWIDASFSEEEVDDYEIEDVLETDLKGPLLRWVWMYNGLPVDDLRLGAETPPGTIRPWFPQFGDWEYSQEIVPRLNTLNRMGFFSEETFGRRTIPYGPSERMIHLLWNVEWQHIDPDQHPARPCGFNDQYLIGDYNASLEHRQDVERTAYLAYEADEITGWAYYPNRYWDTEMPGSPDFAFESSGGQIWEVETLLYKGNIKRFRKKASKFAYSPRKTLIVTNGREAACKILEEIQNQKTGTSAALRRDEFSDPSQWAMETLNDIIWEAHNERGKVCEELDMIQTTTRLCETSPEEFVKWFQRYEAQHDGDFTEYSSTPAV